MGELNITPEASSSSMSWLHLNSWKLDFFEMILVLNSDFIKLSKFIRLKLTRPSLIRTSTKWLQSALNPLILYWKITDLKLQKVLRGTENFEYIRDLSFHTFIILFKYLCLTISSKLLWSASLILLSFPFHRTKF